MVAVLLGGQVAAAPDPDALESLGSAALDYLGSCLSEAAGAADDARWSAAAGAPACIRVSLDPPARLRAAGRAIEVAELLLPLGEPGLEGLAFARAGGRHGLVCTDGDEEFIRRIKVQVAEVLGPVAALPGPTEPPQPPQPEAGSPDDARGDGDWSVPEDGDGETPPPDAGDGQANPSPGPGRR